MRIKQIILLLLILTGCTTFPHDYTIDSSYDSFHKSTYYRLRTRGIYNQNNGSYVWITPLKWKGETGNTKYFLEIKYSAEDWLFIEYGNSIEIKINDDVLSLNTLGSYHRREVVYGGRIEELARYDVSPAFLSKISTGKVITFRVQGQHYYTDRTLTVDNLIGFEKFYCEMIDERPADIKQCDGIGQYSE